MGGYVPQNNVRHAKKKYFRFAVEETSKGMSEEEKGPYQFVFLQECDYMNALVCFFNNAP